MLMRSSVLHTLSCSQLVHACYAGAKHVAFAVMHVGFCVAMLCFLALLFLAP